MESISRRKIIILMVCLLAVAYGVNYRSVASEHLRSSNMEKSIIPSLKSWDAHEKLLLSDSIVEALELDDYINRYFTNGQDNVSLYIGFYLTKKKVGAAHSPLVCFPGQGWDISNLSNLKVQAGKYTVNLATMVIGKGEQKQLVLYWFQAYDKTSPGTFMQKVNLLKAKFVHAREENAFVRVMIPFGLDRTQEEAHNIGVRFIEEVYPVLNQYIIN